MDKKKEKRGRPLKKPDYDRQSEQDRMVVTAVSLFEIPYDDREYRDPNAPSLTSVAAEMNTTALRARKLLITGEMYSTEMSRRVQELEGEGYDVQAIMEETGLGMASVYSYLPYKRGIYNLPERSLYSEQGSRYRERKNAVSALTEAVNRENTSEGDASRPIWAVPLWKAVIAFEGYSLHTSGRGGKGAVKFTYRVSAEGGSHGKRYNGESVPGYGNEVFIENRRKGISRSTVELAFSTALEVQAAEGFVKGPKKLKVPGAGSYLYPMFVRFGIITTKQSESA